MPSTCKGPVVLTDVWTWGSKHSHWGVGPGSQGSQQHADSGLPLRCGSRGSKVPTKVQWSVVQGFKGSHKGTAPWLNIFPWVQGSNSFYWCVDPRFQEFPQKYGLRIPMAPHWCMGSGLPLIYGFRVLTVLTCMGPGFQLFPLMCGFRIPIVPTDMWVQGSNSSHWCVDLGFQQFLLMYGSRVPTVLTYV